MECRTCKIDKEYVVKVYKTRNDIILSNEFLCLECLNVEKVEKVKKGNIAKISGGGKSGLYKIMK